MIIFLKSSQAFLDQGFVYDWRKIQKKVRSFLEIHNLSFYDARIVLLG